MSLQSLNLLFCYDSGPHDIANDFYVPCLRLSCQYDRAVGFFSSSIFEISWKGLRRFLENNGRIRLVCSHMLQKKDYEILNSAISKKIEFLDAALIEQIDAMMKEDKRRAALSVLAYLVSSERLKIQQPSPKGDGMLCRLKPGRNWA